MELILYRHNYSKNSTIGRLHIDGAYFCDTLEDTCRDLNRNGSLADPGEGKIAGETCIPSGKYDVELYNSPKHGRCPQLVKVPGYQNIQIHVGNYPKDTLGCILVGKPSSVKDMIVESRVTFEALMKRINALNGQKITIQVVDLPMPFKTAA